MRLDRATKRLMLAGLALAIVVNVLTLVMFGPSANLTAIVFCGGTFYWIARYR